MSTAQRILVVRTDRLGDTVLALPAIGLLRAACPHAEIHLLCAPGLAPLMRLCPDLTEVHSWRVDEGAVPVRDLARRLNIDAAAVLHTRPGGVIGLWRAGVRVRAGRGRRWYSLLFTHRDAVSYTSAGVHEAECGMRIARLLANAVGCPPPASTPAACLNIPAKAQAAARQQLAALGCPRPIFLQPGSLGSSWTWPVERMAELAQELRAAGHEVVVHLGPPDQHLAHHFPDIPQLGRELDLVGLAAVLAQCQLLVGNSTGPLHLAAALGRPVVGLYPQMPSMAPARWGPWGTGHRILTPPGAADDAHGMARIPVADVRAELETLIADSGAPQHQDAT